MPKRYETLEMLRQRISMSQKVSAKDKTGDYASYAGANLNEAYTMALLDYALDVKLFSLDTEAVIKNYRKLLDKQRKAYFASMSSEITKLGFILGVSDDRKSALKSGPTEPDSSPVQPSD